MRTYHKWFAAALGIGLAALVAATSAQTTTEVKNFTVIGVEGNKAIVRGSDGRTQEVTVTEDYRFNIGGKQVSVHDLKPGMKGTATITTSTTVKPVFVTEVRNGQVIQVSGGSILIRGPKGYQNFTQGDIDKRGITLMRNGAPADISQFRAGDNLSATIVTEKPPVVMTTREVEATLTAAGQTMPPPAAGTAPVASRPSSTSNPNAVPGTAAGGELPKTASQLPAIGLLGVSLLGFATFLMALRRT
jgi:hypothetical protein